MHSVAKSVAMVLVIVLTLKTKVNQHNVRRVPMLVGMVHQRLLDFQSICDFAAQEPEMTVLNKS